VTEEALLDAIDKMEKAVEHVQGQFTTIRTGRATPSIVEKLAVEYYGATVPLQQIAGFQVPDARMLVVKPHDRGAIAAIEKAIQSSNLGLNPSNDGVVIRLAFPALTEERRKDYVKVVKAWQKTAELQCATCAVMCAKIWKLQKKITTFLKMNLSVRKRNWKN
jgi:ribosome recycling factor